VSQVSLTSGFVLWRRRRADVWISYAHNNIDEPALVLGGVWSTPDKEEVEQEEKREREKANEGKALMN
jgi:hypothetical protein